MNWITAIADDLDNLLRDFPYESGRVNARLVKAEDGREVIQVRVELGVLQMECVGRPDGRPCVAVGGTSRREKALSIQTAAMLRLEMVQFQQRAIAFMVLGDHRRALADAETVLEGAAVLERCAPVSEGEWALSARFSAVVLRTRAAAAMLASSGRAREAGSVIDAGLEMLRDAAERSGIGEHFDHLSDATALRMLRDTLVPQLPPAQRSELESRLRAAVLSENYELAAILRDELRLQ
jgi:hypothetical protein